MELLRQGLSGSAIAGLVDTEQAHLVREIFDLIEHHDDLPVKRRLAGIPKLSIGVRSWLIGQMRRPFFLLCAWGEQKKLVLIKSPPRFRRESTADGDGRYRPDGWERVGWAFGRESQRKARSP